MGTRLAALPVSVVLVSFWTVLVAELVGDKSIYTVASLAFRFRAGVVFTAAFAGKMLAAVPLGKILMALHSQWTDVVSAVAFFLSALFIWFREPEPAAPEGSLSAGGGGRLLWLPLSHRVGRPRESWRGHSCLRRRESSRRYSRIVQKLGVSLTFKTGIETNLDAAA